MAITATKEAVIIEREECAKIIDEITKDIAEGTENRDHILITLREIAEAIRNRIPQQRQ